MGIFYVLLCTMIPSCFLCLEDPSRDLTRYLSRDIEIVASGRHAPQGDHISHVSECKRDDSRKPPPHCFSVVFIQPRNMTFCANSHALGSSAAQT